MSMQNLNFSKSEQFLSCQKYIWCILIFVMLQNIRVIVKCTLVQALKLCTGRTALEGGEESESCPGRSLTPERPGTHCTGG
jgi:hypothetical protein